ncbi:regulatory protein, luxR family [Nocardioides terrae]|uniref:Regulatory protein, luxR family n=1 Tax=Nocardioides terrae TaxID=574651 RepID=A0A1I1EPR4_9ACTN|nr:LuxR C-terminal-related transcriptional regulator [Nocardioides terrae]SFB89115.1 regulatory protein, luxR family [Nocardioides terrae]
MPVDDTLMSALGLDRSAGRLYGRLVHQSGHTLAEIAAGFTVTEGALVQRMQPLVESGVVTLGRDGTVVVIPPAEAVARLISETAAGASAAHQRLEEIAAALPYLAGTTVRVTETLAHDDVEPIDGDLVLRAFGTEQFRALLTQGVGQIMFLRPDQWMLPYGDELSQPVAQAVREGRRCRAIYPVRALIEAPHVLEQRAAIGEEVRVLPELPTRLLILEPTHVVMPEPLGLAGSPLLVARQSGLVELATLYFEALWAQAAPLEQPGTELGEVRRFLVEQLSSGAQDEQIARRLGLSLRTVRRRVAEVMSELGATSRFQAGVEAARRGWL